MFYTDIWEVIGRYLNSDDLYSMSATCKTAYKAFNRSSIQSRICFPLAKPKRLTADQREVIQNMEKVVSNVKFVSGEVGSGKTIVSLAYGLRNDFKKIIIVVPPNLIKMWSETCKSTFSINPLVLHTSNPKYSRRNEWFREVPPEEKVIIFSYLVFSKGHFPWLREEKEYLLIVDEAHHSMIHNKNNRFKEILGLSATAFKKDKLTQGVLNLLKENNMNTEDMFFHLDNRIIASKLPDIITLAPYKWRIKKDLVDYIRKEKSPMFKERNNMRDLVWMSSLFSHPYIKDIDNLHISNCLKVKGKKLYISSTIYKNSMKTPMDIFRDAYMKENNVILYQKGIEKDKYLKIEEEMTNDSCKHMFSTSVKYQQILEILKYLKKKGEKAIIFDTNITYLPFLHKYLTDNGMDSYLFTTHYDVTSRQRQIEQFKKNTTANVLLSSISMLGEGHNITEANHVIFLTSFLNPNDYHQAIGRVHRYPQKKQVYVHYLFNSLLDQKVWEHSLGKIDLSVENWDELLLL